MSGSAKRMRQIHLAQSSSIYVEGAPRQAQAAPCRTFPGAVKAPSMAVHRFSAGDIGGQDGLAALREVCGRCFVRVEVEPLAAGQLSFTATLQILPGLSIVSGVCNGALARRTRALISDGNDSFIFCIAAAGIGAASQSGREEMLAPGEGILLSCADEWTLAFPDEARIVGIGVPRNALGGLMPDPEAALLRPVPKGTEALQLLKRYIPAIDETGTLLSSSSDLEAGRIVAAHVQNLVALALAAPRDGVKLAKGRCLAIVRLQAIKKDIAKLLGTADLSLAFVAVRHGVSPRYVQMLFEAEGTTFSEFVLGSQLALAHRRLTDPAHAGSTITDIAFEAGFRDLSYFNRTFRRHYGARPSEIRPAAIVATPKPGRPSPYFEPGS